MKLLYIISILLSSATVTFGQNKAGSNTATDSAAGKPKEIVDLYENRIYTTIDTKPYFDPYFNFNQFINQTIRYPKRAIKKGTQGRVMVQFIVEKDGSISNIKIVSKALGDGLEEEAIRIVKMLPKLTSGTVQRKAVRCYFRLPILFKLID